MTQRWQNVSRSSGPALVKQEEKNTLYNCGPVERFLVVSVVGDGSSVLQFKILLATLTFCRYFRPGEMDCGMEDSVRCKYLVFLRLRNIGTGICEPNLFSLGCFVVQICHFLGFQS